MVAEQLPPGEDNPGVARAAVAADSRNAKFTILVSRNVAGMGLGRHLMRRLAKWARGERLDALQGDIPEANGPLLDLALSMGFGHVDGADPGFTRIRLPLAATTPMVDAEGGAGTSAPHRGGACNVPALNCASLRRVRDRIRAAVVCVPMTDKIQPPRTLPSPLRRFRSGRPRAWWRGPPRAPRWPGSWPRRARA